MRKAESVFALAITLVCALYLFFVWQMDDFGTVNEPGAAFIPAAMGLVGLGLALGILVSSLRTGTDGKAEKIPRAGLLRFLAYVVASLVFIPLFENLGAIVAIFALVLVLTKVLGAQGWVRPVVLATSSSAIAYLLFYLVLEVPLPRGIF